VPEEKIDSFFLHQPTREIEICLAVLNAVFPRIILTAKLKVADEPLQHFLEDVRDGFLLENPALSAAGEEPDFRDHLRVIGGEFFVAITLCETGTNSIDIPPFYRVAFARGCDPQSDVVPDQFAEIDHSRIFGNQV
jgi:hypothetical protein